VISTVPSSIATTADEPHIPVNDPGTYGCPQLGDVYHFSVIELLSIRCVLRVFEALPHMEELE
jgi:hypothetical protein